MSVPPGTKDIAMGSTDILVCAEEQGRVARIQEEKGHSSLISTGFSDNTSRSLSGLGLRPAASARSRLISRVGIGGFPPAPDFVQLQDHKPHQGPTAPPLVP